MNQHSSTLPPEPQPKRERIFSMRLTDAEREAIETLARRLNLPDSTLARHFVLEAKSTTMIARDVTSLNHQPP